MIKGYNKAFLPNIGSGKDVSIEVNFSDSPDLKECVRINGDAIVPIKDLYSFVFVIANALQQEQMVPVKQTLVRKIVKQHRIQLTKNLKKGEYLVARCETNVPVEIWEGMKGMMGARKKEVKKSFNVPIIGKK